MNPFGLVPVLRDGEITLAESNAILVYLALRYGEPHWLPAIRSVPRGWSTGCPWRPGRWQPDRPVRVSTWCSGRPVPTPELLARSHALLAIIDASLARSAYLVGEIPSIADIACYSYVAHAPEGELSLDAYAHLRAWLARIEALPGFVAMPAAAAT